jgi:hypothetical protein
MAEIIFKWNRVQESGLHEANLQIENALENEPGQECAEVLCAISDRGALAIDFPNEVGVIADTLTKLKIVYSGGRSVISIRLDPKTAIDQERLKDVLSLCGHTSQQFAIGSEDKIAMYMRDEMRISKFSQLAPVLTCIGQLECYKA